MRPVMEFYNFYDRKGVFYYKDGMPEAGELNYSKSLSEFLLLLEGNYLKEARQLIIEILMDFANKMYNPEDIYELTGILCDMAREKAKEIYRLSVSCTSKKLFTLKPYRIEGIQNQSGDYQSGKHGNHNTKRQRLCKALYGTGAHKAQHGSRNKCCNITIDDS